ncbi:type II toxin-antitoxin system RelE/ParE family toxin [Mariniradius sediminis]|uniref:Type II toxin-antitoxin system RelE/ParE family toxin n=1 Tax=Mariniradius sediminis TaxID=2909237 RepID=A0ABS9BQS7_9BACT|nr:type II toxin-antitoxin system RelE/ParE family toxin [Mariniradius sediminis]MCF1750007.1 type II toxin-antitoxin system RelE/ParE family toxin [Mariniradius sediminis]
MKFRVDSIKSFEREAQRLKRKFPSLKNELGQLIDDLESNPFQGTPLGRGFYKIRLAIKSKGKGKSGGARVVTFVKVVDELVYLASIYDKSEKSDISIEELNRLFGEVE